MRASLIWLAASLVTGLIFGGLSYFASATTRGELESHAQSLSIVTQELRNSAERYADLAKGPCGLEDAEFCANLRQIVWKIRIIQAQSSLLQESLLAAEANGGKDGTE